MLVIYNRILPIGRRYAAINLLGVLFVKKGVQVDPELLNHERIHTAQMLELLVVPFYIIYVLEWFLRMVQYRGDTFRAYRSISFEREAYAHGNDLNYLPQRRHFSQWKKSPKKIEKDS